MAETHYKQSFSLLYNPEKLTIPIANCDYSLNTCCVDQLCEDAVGFSHFHSSDFEVYYMMEGTLRIQVEDEVLTLHKEEYLLLAPGVVHHTLYDPLDRNKYLVIVFNFQKNTGAGTAAADTTPHNITKHLKAILQEARQRKYSVGQDQHAVGHYIDHMYGEVQTNHFAWRSMLHNYYMLFIFGILRNISSVNENAQPNSYANAAMRINKFLCDHYHEDITLQDVAGELYCSPRHVNRLFTQYFNSSFGKTLSRYRGNYAKNFLVETDYSIERIAELVGYSSANTLFRMFKEQEGITPGEYRKKYKPMWDATTKKVDEE